MIWTALRFQCERSKSLFSVELVHVFGTGTLFCRAYSVQNMHGKDIASTTRGYTIGGAGSARNPRETKDNGEHDDSTLPDRLGQIDREAAYVCSVFMLHTSTSECTPRGTSSRQECNRPMHCVRFSLVVGAVIPIRFLFFSSSPLNT